MRVNTIQRPMSMTYLVGSYLNDWKVLLGWTGLIGYFSFDALNIAIGMLFSCAMMGITIAFKVVEIRGKVAEEKRKQEIHEKRLESGFYDNIIDKDNE